ncbi:MAG TPA: DUF2585 family protein [Pyrinomonadaceae bacterium]|nr:DUF2585 family protein [Pyrinomonadaceae bacterium]
MIATVFALHNEGRLWICSCGQFFIWSGQVCSANNSQHFLDPYSFTHVLHGFLYLWLLALLAPRMTPRWQLWCAVTLACMWEVFENSAFIINRYRTETAALGYQGDTVVNSFGDILCCAIGFVVARRIGLRRSLIVFVCLEVVLLVWIRDSLVLEILMLLHPVDVLKAWQMCR